MRSPTPQAVTGARSMMAEATQQTSMPKGPESSRRRRLAHRTFWTFLDKGVSSIGNAGLSILVARAVTEDAFGAFSVAMLVFTFSIGVNRAANAEPHVVLYSGRPREVADRGVGASTGASLLLGCLAGLVSLIAAAVLDGPTAQALVILGVGLPLITVQDAWRYAFFAAGRPQAAAINDIVWTGGQAVVLISLILLGHGSLVNLMLGWAVTGAIAAVVGSWQAGLRPQPRRWREWLRESSQLSSRLVSEYVLNMGFVNLAYFVVAAILGLVAMGSLRGAQVLLGPMQTVIFSMSALILPLLSERVNTGRPIGKLAALISAGSASVTIAWVTVLYALPPSIGEQLLGATWHGAHSVVIPAGISLICVAGVFGASIGLRALRRPGVLVRAMMIQAPSILVFGVLGAFWGGVMWAAIGFAVGQALGLVVVWLGFWRVSRQRPPEVVPAA